MHPESALQVFGVHAIPSSQLIGGPAIQFPVALQASPLVQIEPSASHGDPASSGVLMQPWSSEQLSVVHGFWSSQVDGGNGAVTQVKPSHIPGPVHGFWSSQAPVFGSDRHPEGAQDHSKQGSAPHPLGLLVDTGGEVAVLAA